jgi:nitrous oxide reductase
LQPDWHERLKRILSRKKESSEAFTAAEGQANASVPVAKPGELTNYYAITSN